MTPRPATSPSSIAFARQARLAPAFSIIRVNISPRSIAARSTSRI